MGLFTKKQSIKTVPRTEESKAGGQYLMDLVKKEPPEIPVRDVAELTPMEQLVQQELQRLMAKSGEGAEKARAYYGDVLKDDADVRESKEYKGFLQEAERLKTKGKTAIRQSAELGGMFMGTPRLGEEAEFENVANSNILQFLGQLEAERRDRKERAAEGVQRTTPTEIGNVAAIGGVAKTERDVEEMKNQALYTAAIQSILFPYVEMANIAQALTQVQNQGVVTGGGLTDLGFGLATLAGFGGSYYGAKAGAG